MEAFTFRRLTKVVQPVALIAAAFAFFSAPTISQAEDKEPGKDIPWIGRYEGSVMYIYQPPKYDEAVIVQSKTRSEALKLEGNISFYYYNMPPNRSSLEVFRNYEAGLKAKGGVEIVYSCRQSDEGCGDIAMDVMNDIMKWPNRDLEARYCSSSFYLLSKRASNTGTTYYPMLICERGAQTKAYFAAVESKQMDTGMIKFIDSSAMQKSLQDTGRVNLYGIHFDFDKDEIKPDSYNTIFEMIKLMQNNPKIKLQVVGHTDSQGQEAHNNDLSNRRAASVVRALLQAGIGVDRLSSKGAGSSQPVATNDTEDGRAENRRVELVGM